MEVQPGGDTMQENLQGGVEQADMEVEQQAQPDVSVASSLGGDRVYVDAEGLGESPGAGGSVGHTAPTIGQSLRQIMAGKCVH